MSFAQRPVHWVCVVLCMPVCPLADTATPGNCLIVSQVDVYMLGAICKGPPPSPTHCLPSLCCYALLTGGCVRPGHHPERVLHAAAALARLLTLLPNHPQGGAAGQGRAGGVPWRGRGAKCKVQALAPWRHVRLLAPFMGGCLSIVCSAPNDSAPIAGGHQRRAAVGGP